MEDVVFIPWGTPHQHQHHLSFFLGNGDFLARYFSLFGVVDLPSGCVYSVNASASHEGYFLSTAEDSDTDQTSQLLVCVPAKQYSCQAQDKRL